MKHGAKETKEAIVFLGRLTSNIGEMTKDGKVSILELTGLLTLWPVIAPAVEGAKAIPVELGDLDSQERAELVAAFADATRLDAANAEALIEEGADLALHIVQFVAKIRQAKQVS